MLRHRTLVPSLHFSAPNPQIDFANSPFAVNTALRDWRARAPRRAGVSSFGIGGTNAHVVLEEAPAEPPRAAVPEASQVLTISAQSAAALTQATAQLATRLEAGDLPLGDVAFTLARGRKAMGWRASVVAATPAEAAAALRQASAPRRPLSGDPAQPVVLLPGQGSQYPGMGRTLYDTQPLFAAHLDRAAAHLGAEALRWMFEDGATLQRTETAQVALFCLQYAQAQLWMQAGIAPRALLGHSLGEITAACLAGVFGFEDGLDLVAARGRLMQAAAPGAMLVVVHGDTALDGLLAEGVEIAAQNAPGLVTLSGPPTAIEASEARAARCRYRHPPLAGVPRVPFCRHGGRGNRFCAGGGRCRPVAAADPGGVQCHR